MSAASQAITNGAHAGARCLRWCFPLLHRPRDRRPALAPVTCQDAPGA
ncbi:hypothetical protein [Streptomyces sp. JJ36]|nr:hypothetical protein [Streptomyces sp. JJ36]MCF6523722.1 hypothetical protein [Streptomyces sp. JJ36]